VNLAAVRGGHQGQQRVAEALAMQSANRLLTRRTLERLRAIATGEVEDASGQGEAEASPEDEQAAPISSGEANENTDDETGS
jgi:hypothetical protein